MDNKKLQRSSTDKMIGGVAGGLGNYFDTDPVIFRLLFVVFTFVGGGGFLIYLLLWIFLRSDYDEVLAANTKDGTQPNGAKIIDPEEAERQLERKKRGSLIGGSILIAIGLGFLLDEWFNWFNWDVMLPITLVIIGFAIIFINYQPKNQ